MTHHPSHELGNDGSIRDIAAVRENDLGCAAMPRTLASTLQFVRGMAYLSHELEMRKVSGIAPLRESDIGCAAMLLILASSLRFARRIALNSPLRDRDGAPSVPRTGHEESTIHRTSS